jgi:hypothetical protein
MFTLKSITHMADHHDKKWNICKPGANPMTKIFNASALTLSTLLGA